MMRIFDNPKQALLEDAYPDRTWELTYDCGFDTTALTLDTDGSIVEERTRIRVLMAERTEEELEAGIKAMLLRAATAVRPEDVFDYFAQKDLAIGWNHGGMLDIDGEMVIVTAPEFLGVVGRSRTGCGAAIYNPGGVVRVDPEAPALERQPLNYFRRLFQRYKPFTDASLRRAKALFFRYLSREQKWELRAHRRVTTIGQDGREYRIYAWEGGNVKLVEEGVETTTLCVVPNPAVSKIPVHDLMLAQKLMLENTLEVFLKTARVWVPATRYVEPIGQIDVFEMRPNPDYAEPIEPIVEPEVHFAEAGAVEPPHERLQALDQGCGQAGGEGRVDGVRERALQVQGTAG